MKEADNPPDCFSSALPTPIKPRGEGEQGHNVGVLLAAPSDLATPSKTLRPPASGGPLRSEERTSKEVGSSGLSAVLFDLDDTLYSRRAVFGLWVDAYLRDTLRLTDAAETHRIRELIAAMDQNGYGSKQAIFEHLHTLYPTLPGEPSRSVETFFHEFLTHITPEPDTEALLDALADANIPFGVITNGSARQWHKIEKLGLDKRTSCLFVSETFGVKKPDPAIFHAAAACLDHPPQQILFVGDNPAADIGGAHSAGMPAAWRHWGQPWPDELANKPNFVIDSLSEVAAILGIGLLKSLPGAV